MKFGKGIVKKYSREYNRTLKNGERKKYTTQQIQITVPKNEDIYENKEEVLIIPNSEIEEFKSREEEIDSLKVANYLYVKEVERLEKKLREANNNPSTLEYENEINELKNKIKEQNLILSEIESKYEALQRQRRLETTMRAERQTIKLLQEGGAGEDEIMLARGRYRVTSSEYTRFSKAMNLPQQRERVTVDGLGNIGVGKYKVTNNINKPNVKNSTPNTITNLNGNNQNGIKFTENSKIKAVNPVTVVDTSDINSSRYRRQFNALGEPTDITRQMYQESKNILNHRTGTLYEDLTFIDSRTGKIITQTDYNVEREVMPSKRMKKMVETSEPYSIIAIHNHPTSSVPSMSDINSAWKKKYKYGVIICHNGNLYKYKINGEYDPDYIDMLLDKVNIIIYNKDKLNNQFKPRLSQVLDDLKKNNIDLEVFLWK